MRGCEAGQGATCKFVQYNLAQQGETERKPDIHNMHSFERRAVWRDRVRTIANHEATQGRDLDVNTFLNRWSEWWPDEAVSWYQPEKRLLGALEMVDGIQRVNDSTVRLMPKRARTWWSRCKTTTGKRPEHCKGKATVARSPLPKKMPMKIASKRMPQKPQVPWRSTSQ